MSTGIEMMRMAQAMAMHASRRHELIARNVAQADTPGYRSQDIASFADTYDAPGMDLRQTRPGHLAGAPVDATRAFDSPGRQSPNGNTVSLETEMMKAGEARQEHRTALAIYRTSLGIMRTALGRG